MAERKTISEEGMRKLMEILKEELGGKQDVLELGHGLVFQDGKIQVDLVPMSKEQLEEILNS